MKFIDIKIFIESKLQVLVISIIILFGGVFIYVSGIYYSGESYNYNLSQNNNIVEESVNKNLDTDNDELTDIIEKAIGTNIEKNDTDGDGYFDAEEVVNGYSPLISGLEGKFTAEEFIALKDKVKNIDSVFFDKIFIARDKFSILTSLLEPEVQTSKTSPIILPLLSGSAVLKEEVSLSNKNWKYSFFAPADLDMNKEQTLIIGLHGFEGAAKDYIKFWQSDADKNGFLVAVLQAYSKTYPGGATVESYPWLEISDFTKAVLTNIEKKYMINGSKIFLTGYSAGATASYVIALDSGIKFNGVIPVNGYLPLEAGIIDKLNKAKDINFYVIHGANDTDVKTIINQEKILLQYGAKMEFKILKGVGHEYPAEEHENILRWMEEL